MYGGMPYLFCGAFSFTLSQSSLYIYFCSCWYYLFRNFPPGSYFLLCLPPGILFAVSVIILQDTCDEIHGPSDSNDVSQKYLRLPAEQETENCTKEMTFEKFMCYLGMYIVLTKISKIKIRIFSFLLRIHRFKCGRLPV